MGKRRQEQGSGDECLLCAPDAELVFHDERDEFRCVWDPYPVAKGHALVLVRRHVASWFDATRSEQASLLDGIDIARREIVARHGPGAFNIGINVGEAAGQTSEHLSVHVIPRYASDVGDPRGGVRNVIPDKGNYLADGVRERAPVGVLSAHAPVIVGESKAPLLHALRDDLASAESFDLAVAFILRSGLGLIRPYLTDVLDRGGRVRVLTGDYLGVTEPDALLSLLDFEGAIECRVFETDASVGFHPKAYLVRGGNAGTVAYVGSSNVTRSALVRGIEWNHRIDGSWNLRQVREIESAFDALFRHPNTCTLEAGWIDRYRQRQRPMGVSAENVPHADDVVPVPQPHEVQQQALAALAATRTRGNRAGLVVLATGLGKTWLAAFDSDRAGRVLFVAHREEILRQARDTFRRIRPDAVLGIYNGRNRDDGADVLFASVQSLGRARHLERFESSAFNYIVVDEFHHAGAATYRRLINHFEPEFLLGLTATPERGDGGDLLALCGENLVFRCDMAEGIERGLLSPFHYYGVPDEVDYATIPWRSGRFDPNALEAQVVTQARAANAFSQWNERGGQRTLGFCFSVRHAAYMKAYFAERGIAVAAVHSEATSDPRVRSLERLDAGELKIVFAVDMFNEGVDVPAVDTVLMLRPTGSRIVWVQQFGRGLRRSKDKSHLTVIDYVGNHRSFLQAPTLLMPGFGESHNGILTALDQLQRGDLVLPPGCSVTYELEAIEILKRLARLPRGIDSLRAWFEDFSDRKETRPTALEVWHAGFDPGSVRQSHGSWVALSCGGGGRGRSSHRQ